MFAGIDVASERHRLARLDAQGVPLGKPVPITEDREGYDTLLRLLGPAALPPVYVRCCWPKRATPDSSRSSGATTRRCADHG